MSAAVLVLFILTGLYALGLLLAAAGAGRTGGALSAERPRVSVVVAARNEERGIGECLRSLCAQEYPAGLHEIIVVDDRSGDATAGIIAAAAAACPRLKHLTVTENRSGLPGKKHAVMRGIGAADGEILLFTDADCTVPPGWIAGMAARFTPGTGAVAGHVYLDDRGCGAVGRMAALLNHGFELVNAGVIGWGGAFSCKGGSLAYRRRAYEDAGGMRQVGASVSGDDDLMLQRIRRTGWGIRYAAGPAVHVATRPPAGIRELANQRTRHVSASRRYPLAWQAAGAGLFVYAAVLAALTGAAAAGAVPCTPVAAAWALKFAAELAALLRADAVFGRRQARGWAPLLSVLFVPYVIVFGLRGLFGTFTWKEGRNA